MVKVQVSTPKITVDPNFNPFKTEQQNYQPKTTSYQKANQDWESLYTPIEPEPVETSNQEAIFHQEQETETGKTFQIQKKYLLSSIKSGMVLIHQSLAHQRVLYEEFLASITVHEAMSQQLLFPVHISFSKSDTEMVQAMKADLENTGFLFESITDEAIVVKGIPTSITESQISLILEQLLDDMKLEVPESSFSHFDVMAKSFAKSLAIKTGTVLSNKEQESLVNDLFSCKEPSVSPFGKATFKTLTIKEIDTIFNSH